MSEVYTFAEPFRITTHGSDHDVIQIEIPAPTGKMQSLFSRLEAEYNSLMKIIKNDAQEMLASLDQETIAQGMALAQNSKKDKNTNREEEAKEEVKAFNESVKDAGFNCTSSYGILKDILCAKKGGAKMLAENGEFDLASGHWDDIPMKEIKNLLGFYIVNFMDSSD
jgi:undecaprenyl pyrophosphate synthase